MSGPWGWPDPPAPTAPVPVANGPLTVNNFTNPDTYPRFNQPKSLSPADLPPSMIDATGAAANRVPISDGANGYAWGSGPVSAGVTNTFTVPQIFQAFGATDIPGLPDTMSYWASNMQNPTRNVRPVAIASFTHVTPNALDTVDTDYHAWDLKQNIPASAAANVGAHTRLFSFEMTSQNSSNTTVGQIVPIYGLVDVGSGGVNGGASGASKSIQAGLNVANGATVNQWFGFWVRTPFNNGGGGTVTQAAGLWIPSWVSAGVVYTLSPLAINVDPGGGAIVTGENIRINNTNAASPTNQSGLVIVNDATKLANALGIVQNGAATGVLIQQVGAGTALSVSAFAGAAGVNVVNISGQDNGPLITTSTDGGHTLDVRKNGVGAGTAFQLINAGTGLSADIRTAGASVWQILPSGQIKYANAANLSSTASAGTNGATPAQVAGYIIAQDNAGSPIKIPYYAN